MVFPSIPPFIDYESFDLKLPAIIWEYWPKTSSGANLMFLHNLIFKFPTKAVWYSPRDYPLHIEESRFKMVKGVVEENYQLIDEALQEGFDINESADLKLGINAYSLAAELDKLEVLHYRELKGATPYCISITS